ncbi:MAG: glycosyltransferase family 2 protein [Gammaproteobacteria bacterium]
MGLLACQSISVILPCYNEEENIEKTLEQAINNLEPLFSDWEIIVVDDGSHDETWDIINRVAGENPRVVAVRHPRNQGYGGALRSGIQRARKELVFFCDSDLQFHINEILLLLMWIEQYDIVIGYRRRRRDPFYRNLNAWGWNRLVRLLLGLKVRDIDCAFKLFRSEVFNAIRINAVGAMVNTEILVQATRLGYKLREVPITHFPRLNGRQTGARVQVILKAFKELFRLYRGLSYIEPIVFPYDQRRDCNGFQGTDRRKRERRKVILPINFRDRRKQIFQTPGAPLGPITQSRRSLIGSTS